MFLLNNFMLTDFFFFVLVEMPCITTMSFLFSVAACLRVPNMEIMYDSQAHLLHPGTQNN